MKGFGVQDVGICDPRTESLGLNVRGVQDIGRFEWSAFGGMHGTWLLVVRIP